MTVDDMGVDEHVGQETTTAVKKAFSGVRFSALSAPGPSGARPEHLRDALAARPRGASTRLRQAVAELHDVAGAGKLPDCSRWLLESRLIYLQKKQGLAPRPIRVGEFWRRVIAKRLVHDVKTDMQSLCIKLRQFGVAIPGGADVLVHFRSNLEAASVLDEGPAMVGLDLDLRNAFPSFEWDSIREAVGEYLLALLPWVQSCHKSGGMVHLPCGGSLEIDRGAEQGDPLGSIFCALVLGMVTKRVREKLIAETPPGETKPAFFDVWYMDDGQVVMDPTLVDRYLRTLDFELAKVGATRGNGADVKSVARLVGVAEAKDERGDLWITGYIRDTCQVEPMSVPHCLGVDFGSDEVCSDQFDSISSNVQLVHGAIQSIGDVATEVVLTRMCADACKLTHLLRAHGTRIKDDVLERFDTAVSQSLATALHGPLHEDARVQASLGVAEGGLGVRRCVDEARPAFIASCVAAKPMFQHLMEGLREEGMLPEGMEMRFIKSLSNTISSFTDAWSPSLTTKVNDLVADAETFAINQFSNILNKRALTLNSFSNVVSDVSDALVQPAGYEDVESGRCTAGLQHELSKILDVQRADNLLQHFHDTRKWPDSRRLRELRDPTQSTDWLWGLDATHGPIVPANEFGTCVRIRLGASLTTNPTLCERCGSDIVDCGATHSLCCAQPEATRGHYRARDALLPLVHLADPSSVTEVPGLIVNAPTLRPADIYTEVALPGGLAALDIGICSPDASGAGMDCCASMWEQKTRHYGEHLNAMTASGLKYVPIVLSCYGRVHPESEVILDRIAHSAARRAGVADHRLILRRAKSGLAVVICRRAVAMAWACLPKTSPESVRLLFGDVDGAAED